MSTAVFIKIPQTHIKCSQQTTQKTEFNTKLNAQPCIKSAAG